MSENIRLKMVIADDEQLIRDSLADVFDWNNLGIEIVAVCKNGLEALDVVMDENPDIIMTDIKMPGISGLELIERIRVLNRDTEIIILSGFRDFDFAKKAMKFGVRHYLLKPIDNVQLLEAVNDAKKACLSRLANIKSRYEQLLITEPPSHTMQETADTLFQLANQNNRKGICEILDKFFIQIHGIDAMQFNCAMLLSCLSVRRIAPNRLPNLFALIYSISDEKEIQRFIYSSLMEVLLPNGKEESETVRKIKEIVSQKLSDGELSLRWIAEHILYMNVDYVSHLFVSETGEKFSAYLKQIRMEVAKELLKSKMIPVYRIAEQVGCGNNPRYFSQVFKKYTGVTPSDYMEGQ